MRRRPASSISTNGAGGSAADQCAAAAAATGSRPASPASTTAEKRVPGRLRGAAGSSWDRGARRAETDRCARARPSCRRLPDVDGPPDRPDPSRASAGVSSRAVPLKPLADPTRGGRSLGSGRRRRRPPGRLHGRRPAASRVSFGAPLPLGIAAEAELIDLVLVERLPAWRVREALIASSRKAGRSWTSMTCGRRDRRSPGGSSRPTTGSCWRRMSGARSWRTPQGAARIGDVATRSSRGAETVRYDLRPLIVGLSSSPVHLSSSGRGPASTPSSVPDAPRRCSPRSPKHADRPLTPEAIAASG